mgnify:CR=1 FL=1
MTKPTLGNPQNTIEILQKYDFSFQKKFGQNFLIEHHMCWIKSSVQQRLRRMTLCWRSDRESGR